MNCKTQNIKKETFEGLLKIQCTRDEVCQVFGITKNTLKRWCADNYDGESFDSLSDRYRSLGKSSLRRMGMKLAEHNASVWIFMAKNYLGMSDMPVPQPDDDNADSFSSAIKSASKSITSLKQLASIPTAEESVDGQS